MDPDIIPLLGIIRNQAFKLCFKNVFEKKAHIEATEKEEIEMEMCLFNYMKTFDSVFKYSSNFVEQIKK